LFYLGLSQTNASRTTLLINLQPFFVLCLAHFFLPGDSFTWRKTIGIVMGFTGIVFMFIKRDSVTSTLQTGDLLILLTTFIWAINAVYTKKIIHHFQPFQLALYPMLFSIPLFLVMGWLWDNGMINKINPAILGSLFYQGLLTAGFGFVVWTYLLRQYGATTLHAFIFIMPVAGVFLGGILLGEPITPNIIVALILIAIGIVIINYRTKKTTRKAE
jgi:drug/metabolite transporter (DMT)-like permease